MGNQQLRHFRDRYFIRDDGVLCSRVKNAPRADRKSKTVMFQHDGMWFKELKSSPNKKGYPAIKLPIGVFRIHRLVAEAFVPNPNNLPQVNHIDGDKLNNAPSNLEWVSNRDNMTHAMKNGLRRAVDYEKMKILLEASTLSQKEIAAECQCGVSAVEIFVRKCKVQRPEHYSPSDKTVATRAKLVGTKWFRSGEHAQA